MSAATLPVLLTLLALGSAVKHKPVFSEEIKEIIQHVHNECVGKTGVAEEDIANCENGIFKEDVKLKCYMFCLLEEASLVDDDDGVDYDMLVSLIPEEYSSRASAMIFACRHFVIRYHQYTPDHWVTKKIIPDQMRHRIIATGSTDTNDKDKCQRAFDVHKCSYEKDPDFYFLF